MQKNNIKNIPSLPSNKVFLLGSGKVINMSIGRQTISVEEANSLFFSVFLIFNFLADIKIQTLQ
jgi:hypothetical protein